MAHALGVARSDLLLRHMQDDAPRAFVALVDRRATHEPVAHILGEQEFFGLPFRVTPDTLIPRGDSEVLVEAALAARPDARRVLDCGTGSGALLLAVLANLPAAEGVGVDRSPEALAVAADNAQRLGLGGRAQMLLADWDKPGWQSHFGPRFDLVLANLDYARWPRWAKGVENLRFVGRWLHQFNPQSRARRNVKHHYDLDGRLYELFLDSDRQYSCAYFEQESMSLDDAQTAKKRHLAAKLNLRDGMKVLDIGSGCGRIATAFTRYLQPGGTYTGVDVWDEGVRWCTDHITQNHPDFTFRLVPASNNYYYAADSGEPNQFDLSYLPSGGFDGIFALSVFTHLRLVDARQYFALIHRLLDRELVKQADLILAMSRGHVSRAERLGGEGRVHLLGEYAGLGGDELEIRDPYGGDVEGYRATLKQLEQLLIAARDRLLAERSP